MPNQPCHIVLVAATTRKGRWEEPTQQARWQPVAQIPPQQLRWHRHRRSQSTPLCHHQYNFAGKEISTFAEQAIQGEICSRDDNSTRLERKWFGRLTGLKAEVVAEAMTASVENTISFSKSWAFILREWNLWNDVRSTRRATCNYAFRIEYLFGWSINQRCFEDFSFRLCELNVVCCKWMFKEDGYGVDEEKGFIYIGRRWDLNFQKVRMFAQSRYCLKSEVNTKEKFLWRGRCWSDQARSGVLQDIGSFRKHNFRRSKWIADKQDMFGFASFVCSLLILTSVWLVLLVLMLCLYPLLGWIWQ